MNRGGRVSCRVRVDVRMGVRVNESGSVSEGVGRVNDNENR